MESESDRVRYRCLEPMTLLAVVPVLLLCGCMTLAGGQLADIDIQPLEIPPPSIEQTVGDFSFHLDGGKLISSNKAGRNVNQMVLARWKERGLITRETYVKSSQFTGDAEYNLTLSGHLEGDSSVVMQVISGLTLYLIPYWVTSRFDLVYTLEHVDSGTAYEARAADSYTSVTQLLLFPISPFLLGGAGRTYDRLGDHLYEELARQGAFDPALAAATQDEDDSSDSHGAERGERSPVERLRVLNDLRSRGVVSDEEYERRKQEILKGI